MTPITLHLIESSLSRSLRIITTTEHFQIGVNVKDNGRFSQFYLSILLTFTNFVPTCKTVHFLVVLRKWTKGDEIFLTMSTAHWSVLNFAVA